MSAMLIIAAALVALSGLFSGLNLGLMSFADEDLRIVIEGSPDENKVRNAQRIRPLRARGNLLLCTLLLGNTLVNAMIAILLGDMAGGIVGGIVTTGLIVVFGEIIPQSVCSRYALAIGARSVPIVWVFLVVCLPIAYPISLVLDWALGREVSATYTKNEVATLVQILQDPDHQKETGFTMEDGRLVVGALAYKSKTVESAMTPLDATYCLQRDSVMTMETMLDVLREGHTRMPVYDRKPSEIVAVLYAKDLIGIGYERACPLPDVLASFEAERRVHRITKGATLGDAFEQFRRLRTHMLVVTDSAHPDAPAVGVLTSEDVLEEILQEELTGDDDKYIDQAQASDFRPGIVRQNSKRYDPTALIQALASGRVRGRLVSLSSGDVSLQGGCLGI